jgi:acetylornithine deacetylase/succinyl-diaminopimelate desuccinylase-like protein
MDAELSRPVRGRAPATAPDPVVERARALLREPAVQDARRRAEADDAQVLAEQRELTEIPAPPFGEAARAKRMAELFRDAGLEHVEIDEEGNVLGWLAPRPGDGGAAHTGGVARSRDTGAQRDGAALRAAPAKALGPLIVSAHLDTVFPEGTDVRVRQKGDRWVGPGISDDGRGLAALLGLARVLIGSTLRPRPPVLFAATVGEEGAGDLRGVRHLFREGSLARGARGFISLDGAGINRIVTSGLGSRRYRVVVTGPGGHSWVNWGTANPIHALGEAVARWTRIPLPEDPPATLTVARWGGGTSINAIPQEAWVELELRCLSEDVLARLEGSLRRTLADVLAATSRGAVEGTEALRAEVEGIGTRPAGETAGGEPIVRAAVAATRALSATPELAVSSTDANIPMSLGIPAITMGAGGEAGQAHTTEEWYRNVQGPDGVVRALLTMLLLDEA